MKGVKFGNYHSYDTWGLLLTAKNIGSPIVKEKKIDIEGADGDLDYTEVFGSVKYGNRILKFEFQKAMKPSELVSLASDIQDAIHGLKMAVTLDDDPDWHYYGRVSVKDFNWKKGIGTIEIEVDAEPYKLAQQKTRQFVNLSGKNLFDNNNVVTVINSAVTITKLDTGIRLTSTQTGDYTYAALKLLPAEMMVGQKLTLQAKATASAANRARIGFGYATPAATPTYVVGTVMTEGSVSLIVDAELAKKYKYIVLFVYGNLLGAGVAGDYADYTDLQVELGNATAYEAYNGTAKTVNVQLDNTRMPAVPVISTQHAVTVKSGAETVAIAAEGTSDQFQLTEGSNQFSITGKGLVSFEWQKGRL